MSYRILLFIVFMLSLFAMNGCKEASPPELMKATIGFETDEQRDHHIAHMRTHHMHALKHKRDETMYQGIRTEDHSLKACINCHVPESYNGEVLRHTNQEHFCTTCHSYVAQKLNCFECHVDHPVKERVKQVSLINQSKVTTKNDSQNKAIDVNNLNALSQAELKALAFKYAESGEYPKNPEKSGGVSNQAINPSTSGINSDIRSKQ